MPLKVGIFLYHHHHTPTAPITSHTIFPTNTKQTQHSFKMQFLAIVSIALAGLASAASVPEKRASTPAGCSSAYYNDGSDGSTAGWGCAGSDSWGNCQSYYWKTSPPFWSVSKTITHC